MYDYPSEAVSMTAKPEWTGGDGRSRVDEALDDLDKTLAIAKEAVSNLIGRLDCVLRPEAPISDARKEGASPMPPTSLTVSRINAIARDLAGLTGRINRAMDRLDT